MNIAGIIDLSLKVLSCIATIAMAVCAIIGCVKGSEYLAMRKKLHKETERYKQSVAKITADFKEGKEGCFNSFMQETLKSLKEQKRIAEQAGYANVKSDNPFGGAEMESNIWWSLYNLTEYLEATCGQLKANPAKQSAETAIMPKQETSAGPHAVKRYTGKIEKEKRAIVLTALPATRHKHK